MRRREFLRSATALAAVAGIGPAANAQASATAEPAVFVPGTILKRAYFSGWPALKHPRLARNIPKGFDGDIRMITRVGSGGAVDQALFPVNGHDVAVSPDGRVGLFPTFEDASLAAFDPKTLDLVAIGQAAGEGWRGGGHAAYVDGGAFVAVSERAPAGGYRGAPERHFGQVTLRDPETLKVVERISCHGIDPHEVRILSDGEHAAMANYGSTYPGGADAHSLPRHIVEPSVTIVSLKTGKLVEKYVTGSSSMELRHICVADRDAIVAIQAALGPFGADQGSRQRDHYVYERERSSSRKWSFTPAEPLFLNREAGAFKPLGPASLKPAMRHGLSIEYDRTNNEALATFPASHKVFVMDGGSGDVKRVVDTASEGLDYPCGLTLLPDGKHYAVAGYWKNLFVYERGTHRLARERCSYATFFGHRHITSA